MIKVTMDNGLEFKSEGIEDIRVENKTIKFKGIIGCWKLDDIVKIEKQIKDLTLEEIEMLGVEFERLYPRDEMYKAQYLIGNVVYLEDDYIDITSIVKENK